MTSPGFLNALRLLAYFLAALPLGCHATTPIRDTPPWAPLQRLMDAPRAQLGNSRADLYRTLGQPIRVSTREVKNKHEPEIVDRVWTLEFDGVRAEVYESNAAGRDYLWSLAVEKRRVPLRLSVSLGDRRDTILTVLGSPSRSTDAMLEYVAQVSGSNRSLNVVRLKVQHGRLVGLEWDYWLE
jgi:hypothetical protein